MSFLYSYGEATPEFLAQSLLTEAIFSHVTNEDYQALLRNMLQKEQIEKTVSGGLLVGPRGEQITNHYDFYSVFETEVEYSVREEAHGIGTLTRPMPPDTTFVLSGKTWSVVELDKEQKIIYVKSARGKPPTIWDGDGSGLEYTKVLQMMRRIIGSQIEYPYLSQNAASRLKEIREIVHQTRILDNPIFEISPDTYGVAFWIGTKASNALDYALSALLPSRKYVPHYWPFLIIKNVTRSELEKSLDVINTQEIRPENLSIPDELVAKGKYNDFVPAELLRKQYIARFIDITELKGILTQKDSAETSNI